MFNALVIVTLLIAPAAMQPAAGKKPADAACDEGLTERSKLLTNGYRRRDDNPDPCCEGVFKEDVGGHTEPAVTLVEYSYGPRPTELTAFALWEVEWPDTERDVQIRGCHKELGRRYRLDAEKNYSGTPSKKFIWNGSIASKLKFAAPDVLFTVRAKSRGPKHQSTSVEDKLPEATPVYLPLQIRMAPPGKDPAGAAKPNDQQAVKPAAPAPTTRPSKTDLRFHLVANKSLTGVKVTAVRENGDPKAVPVIIRADTTLDTSAKFLSCDSFECDGGLVRLEVSHLQRGVERKLEPIWVKLPDANAQPSGTGAGKGGAP